MMGIETSQLSFDTYRNTAASRCKVLYANLVASDWPRDPVAEAHIV